MSHPDNWVRMRHEPTGNTQVFDPSTVAYWQAHGWRSCDDQPEPPRLDDGDGTTAPEAPPSDEDPGSGDEPAQVSERS